MSEPDRNWIRDTLEHASAEMKVFDWIRGKTTDELRRGFAALEKINPDVNRRNA